MTFLVSDGLYFGEGPMEAMQEERMAAPLISAATTLLMKLVEKTTSSEQDGAANRSQPIRSETNRTSSAAGSDR